MLPSVSDRLPGFSLSKRNQPHLAGYATRRLALSLVVPYQSLQGISIRDSIRENTGHRFLHFRRHFTQPLCYRHRWRDVETQVPRFAYSVVLVLMLLLSIL